MTTTYPDAINLASIASLYGLTPHQLRVLSDAQKIPTTYGANGERIITQWALQTAENLGHIRRDIGRRITVIGERAARIVDAWRKSKLKPPPRIQLDLTRLEFGVQCGTAEIDWYTRQSTVDWIYEHLPADVAGILPRSE